jgi:hypothetical protein
MKQKNNAKRVLSNSLRSSFENVPNLIGMSVDCKKENYDLI